MRAGSARQAEEVRPEFCLCDHDELWAERVEVGTNGKTQINGEVEDVVSPKTIARELLTCVGCSGNDHAIARQPHSQLIDQTADCEHFTHRNRVHPDGRLA